MNLQHVLITRFSYRSTSWQNLDDDRHFDPLKPENLEYRFRLFEIAALPGVLGQTSQDFVWLIIVDRELDSNFRERLKALVSERPRTYLHDYNEADDLGGLEWLRPYLHTPEQGDYVVTTTLDDDDALPRDFVARLHEAVQRLAASRPPLLILGVAKTIEWDLALSDDAPLGWTAPWHRQHGAMPSITAVGFTFASRQPEYPFSVLERNHALAREYLDPSVPSAAPYVERTREQFRRAAAAAGEQLASWSPEDTFCDLSTTLAGPVLVTNHVQNLQADRLFEPKPEASRVEGPETFPGLTLDWAALHRHADQFHVGTRSRFLQRSWRVRRWFRRRRNRLQKAVRNRVRRRR